MQTARIKTSYPRRSCDALGVCQARGIDQCCTHDCLEGRACQARELRGLTPTTTHSEPGLSVTEWHRQGAEQMPVQMLGADDAADPFADTRNRVDTEAPSTGRAITWLAAAGLAVTLAAWLGIVAVTLAAWLGLAAGVWSVQ